VIHVDTHVLVWLWERKAKHARVLARRINGQHVSVSPAALLELQCLGEIGRFTASPADVVAGLAQSIGLTVAATSFADIVERSLTMSWTRDPFDRLIVANAAVEGVKLLTFDDRIHQHFPDALWD
jgi:PIN domain nuclease of toxin-antitoxin system